MNPTDKESLDRVAPRHPFANCGVRSPMSTKAATA